MQLKTITNAKEAGIPGIEFVKTDKAVTEVIIGKLRIRKGQSYSNGLELLVEQPFEVVKRFRMVATIEGFAPTISYHDSRYDADQAAQALIAKGAEAEVSEVEANMNEDGEIVSVIGDPAPVADEELMPF